MLINYCYKVVGREGWCTRVGVVGGFVANSHIFQKNAYWVLFLV
jgi:hypothetical protein